MYLWHYDCGVYSAVPVHDTLLGFWISVNIRQEKSTDVKKAHALQKHVSTEDVLSLTKGVFVTVA